MSEIFIISAKDSRRTAWVPIDDPVIDDQDILVHFGLQMPPWATRSGYYNLHLFHKRSWSAGEFAVNSWNARGMSNSLRKVLETFEQMARERKWYDAKKFPSIQEHGAATGGILIAS